MPVRVKYLVVDWRTGNEARFSSRDDQANIRWSIDEIEHRTQLLCCLDRCEHATFRFACAFAL
jgi:hypothetical protein